MFKIRDDVFKPDSDLKTIEEKLEHTLVDYIKSAGIIVYDNKSFKCPICNCRAELTDKNTKWFCRDCKSNGDIFTLVGLVEKIYPKAEIIKRLCKQFDIKNTELETLSAKELLEMEFPPHKSVISRLMPRGTYIFAGPSKIGKSWMVLWFAYQISLGKPVWDFETSKGEVLYISLEDTNERIQQRLLQIADDDIGNIYFATQAEVLGKGLEEQILNFVKAHPNVIFIIIDTLQKIRELGRDAYCYANDYDVIGRIKKIADDKNITFLIVHHTRKENDDDSFNTISGTTGLLGCADGAFILKKQSRLQNTATFEAKSRTPMIDNTSIGLACLATPYNDGVVSGSISITEVDLGLSISSFQIRNDNRLYTIPAKSFIASDFPASTDLYYGIWLKVVEGEYEWFIENEIMSSHWDSPTPEIWGAYYPICQVEIESPTIGGMYTYFPKLVYTESGIDTFDEVLTADYHNRKISAFGHELANLNDIPDIPDKSTTAQSQAGTDDTNYMTALKTKQAIDIFGRNIDQFTLNETTKNNMPTFEILSNKDFKIEYENDGVGYVETGWGSGGTTYMTLYTNFYAYAKAQNGTWVTIHQLNESITDETGLKLFGVGVKVKNDNTYELYTSVGGWNISKNPEDNVIIGADYIIYPIANIDFTTQTITPYFINGIADQSIELYAGSNKVLNESDKSTTEQAQAGTDDTTYMTPAKTKALVSYTNIITPTLLNGWAIYIDKPPKYWKDSAGYIHISGAIQQGSGIAFTLPTGYRPSEMLVFTGVTSTASIYITIGTSGNVTPSGTAAMYLDTIIFKVGA